jgi:hypothetical protein
MANEAIKQQVAIPEDLQQLHAAADKLCRKLVDKKPQSQILFWALEFLVTAERAGDAEAKFAAQSAELEQLRAQIVRLSAPVSDDVLVSCILPLPAGLRGAMLYTVWKDGTDIEQPSWGARTFADSLIASRAREPQKERT